MSNYVYIRSEPNLWTVGFYDPQGKWHPDTDYSIQDDASNRVNFLNGGDTKAICEMRHRIESLYKIITDFVTLRKNFP